MEIDATAAIKAVDYRIDASVDDADYSMGRDGGKRWRRTPNGVVRFIESDVQGDELDRWPEAVVGFDAATCSVAGQSDTAWVLTCRAPWDVPHWFYVDKESGRVSREVSREGTRVVRYDFSDFRNTINGTTPFHWTISGFGGDAEVEVVSVQAAPATILLQFRPRMTSSKCRPGFERFNFPLKSAFRFEFRSA